VPADPGHPLVDGGFWGAFTRSLEGRWEQIKRDHAERTNTFDSDDADGQTRLVTDGGETPGHEADHFDDSEMIPALNEITAHALDEPRECAGGERMWAILFDEDYDGHATDMDGNVALLLTRAQAGEIRELMDEIVAELEDSDE